MAGGNIERMRPGYWVRYKPAGTKMTERDMGGRSAVEPCERYKGSTGGTSTVPGGQTLDLIRTSIPLMAMSGTRGPHAVPDAYYLIRTSIPLMLALLANSPTVTSVTPCLTINVQPPPPLSNKRIALAVSGIATRLLGPIKCTKTNPNLYRLLSCQCCTQRLTLDVFNCLAVKRKVYPGH